MWGCDKVERYFESDFNSILPYVIPDRKVIKVTIRKIKQSGPMGLHTGYSLSNCESLVGLDFRLWAEKTPIAIFHSGKDSLSSWRVCRQIDPSTF